MFKNHHRLSNADAFYSILNGQKDHYCGHNMLIGSSHITFRKFQTDNGNVYPVPISVTSEGIDSLLIIDLKPVHYHLHLHYYKS